MKFHIKQNSEFKNLKKHIEEYGQIENIIIYNNGKKEYIIDGAKRVNFLDNPKKTILFNLIKSYNLVLLSKEIPDSSIWKMISRLKESNIDEKEIYEKLLKGKIKISIRDIWKLTQINYSESLEEIFFQLSVTLKELKAYYSLDEKNLNKLFTFFKENKLNKNSRKDFYTLLSEIAKIDNISLIELLEREDIKTITESDLQNKDKVKQLKKVLFAFRYPNINKEVEYLTSLKLKLNTPSIRLEIPIDIESNESIISFKFKNIEDLKKRVDTLYKLNQDENLNKILEVVSKR